jgi:hypothetical protein
MVLVSRKTNAREFIYYGFENEAIRKTPGERRRVAIPVISKQIHTGTSRGEGRVAIPVISEQLHTGYSRGEGRVASA